MRAALYARVSTEDQEREGTSLDSQQAACLEEGKRLGYQVADEHIVREVWSGLTLDRPKLTQLREWVSRKEIDSVIAHSTDRLSRDPVHLLVLAEEFEKAGVELVFVTDPHDNSLEGQLLTFVKGWSSKVEAVRIRERTLRGKRTRALQGRISSGSHARLYGYHYVKVKFDGGGVRVVNEEEARWVKAIFIWFVEDGLSIDAITYKLRDAGVPTPLGKGCWNRSTVHNILSNPAYRGKTYAFTCTYGEPKYRLKANPKRKKSGIIWKPETEWIEIPNATPPIIGGELFEAAQRQLKRNKELALRYTKRQYLLRGHINCGYCGRSYWARTSAWNRGDKHYERRFYQCSGNLRRVSEEPCGNRNVNANQIENLVWEQIEVLLCQPEIVLTELERRKQETSGVSFLEKELAGIEAKLESVKKRDQRLLRGWLWGQDEDLIEKEKRALDKERKALKGERLQLLRRIEASERRHIDLDKVEEACELIRGNFRTLSFGERRLILETLLIKVWVSDSEVKIEGCIPLPSLDTISTLS